jgi:hypothetical protein
MAAQIAERRVAAGSWSLVYGLSRKGAGYLRRRGVDMPRPLLDGIDKQNGAGWRFISHSVGITEFFVGLELALRGRQDLRLLERAEILDDAPTPMRRVKLDARIPIGGSYRRTAVVPDGFFGLRFLAEGEESYFMYEKDRGEMPIHRYRNQYGTYFAKKLQTYLEVNRQQKHVSELGVPNFRVLVETTTPERVGQMIEAQQELTDGRGSNIFLFIDEETLTQSDPLDATWTTGKREVMRITD